MKVMCLLLALSWWVWSAVSTVPTATAGNSHPDPGAGVVIRQFDVGQGDAALVITPERRAILIDAGPDGDRIVKLLRDQEVDTLDLVIASHNHADHIGGMPEVLRRFVVRAYMDNGVAHTTTFYQATQRALEREPGLQYLNATSRTVKVGSIKLKVLPPARLDPSQNNNSVGILLEYGRFQALFTGDSEVAQLEAWLDLGLVPAVTFVKAAHHGSPNGLTERWMRTTTPQVVTVSAGRDNSYGHPSLHTIFSWKLNGASVYRTDRDGTIEVVGHADGRATVSTSGAAAANINWR